MVRAWIKSKPIHQFKTFKIMKAITTIAINRKDSYQAATLDMLKESGKSRDNLFLIKGDKIVIPEQVNVLFDTFVPKGKTEAVTYYLITVEHNGKVYDATMKTFRRSRDVKSEYLQQILTSDVNRYLHNAGDDEQRATYLAGKTLEVVDIVKCESAFDDGRPIFVPIFKVVE